MGEAVSPREGTSYNLTFRTGCTGTTFIVCTCKHLLNLTVVLDFTATLRILY